MRTGRRIPRDFAPTAGSRTDKKARRGQIKSEADCLHCKRHKYIHGRGLCSTCYSKREIMCLYPPLGKLAGVKPKPIESDDVFYAITDQIRKKPAGAAKWNWLRAKLQGKTQALSDFVEKASRGGHKIPPEWNELILIVNSLPQVEEN